MNKRLRKTVAMVMMVLFSMTIFAGCSREEMGFYSLVKSQATMKGSVEASSAIRLEVSATDPEWAQMVGPDIAKALTGMQIIVNERANLNEMTAETNISVLVGNKETDIGTVKFIKDTMYFNSKDMLKALKGILPVETYRAVEKATQGKEWIAMNLTDLVGGTDLLPKNYGENSRIILKLYFDFLDAFCLQGYQDYTSGLVERAGNGYRLTLSDTDLSNFIRRSGLYSVEHAKEIGAVLKSFIGKVSPEDKEILFGTADITADGIDDFVREIIDNKGEYNAAVNDAADLLDQDFLPLIRGSKFTQSIEGTEAGYLNMADLVLNINDEKGSNVMRIVANLSGGIKQISTVKVAVPESVIAWADMKKNVPSSKGIRIFDDKSYVMDEKIELSVVAIPQAHKFGYMTAFLEKDDYRYYPLRQIGEVLGHEVGWSEAGQTAYVLNEDGARVSFAGIVKNGTTYIKIRDFEKIGYVVEWDGATRSMYIYR